jgi:D-methionine transport system substrate-binding protein
MKKWILRASSLLVLMMMLSACSSGAESSDKTITFVAANIKLYEDTTKILAEELAKKGYKLEYKFISDNTQLNEAVISGEADANYHQHIAYLNEFNVLHKSKLVPAFKAFTDPSGLFSKKHKTLADLPDGAVISIPVDPSNNFRTFVMLAQEGLITLKEGIEPAKATQRDIVDNPHHFKFQEVDYALLTRALDDTDAGFLYATLAAEIGLSFKEDALIQEREELQSPDIIAVLEKNKDSAKTKALQEAYQSDRIKQAFKDAYGGKEVLIPGW